VGAHRSAPGWSYVQRGIGIAPFVAGRRRLDRQGGGASSFARTPTARARTGEVGDQLQGSRRQGHGTEMPEVRGPGDRKPHDGGLGASLEATPGCGSAAGGAPLEATPGCGSAVPGYGSAGGASVPSNTVTARPVMVTRSPFSSTPTRPERRDTWRPRRDVLPSRSAQYGASAVCALPVTGSSGMPACGANTRETKS
jgi:hypothetical protein